MQKPIQKKIKFKTIICKHFHFDGNSYSQVYLTFIKEWGKNKYPRIQTHTHAQKEIYIKAHSWRANLKCCLMPIDV